MTSMAFNTAVNPFGAELNAMMGSDISHWDVPDMTEVLEEAWEMVEPAGSTRRPSSNSPSPTRPDSTPEPTRDSSKGTVVESAVDRSSPPAGG